MDESRNSPSEFRQALAQAESRLGVAFPEGYVVFSESRAGAEMDFPGSEDGLEYGLWLPPEELLPADQWDLVNFLSFEALSPEELLKIIPIFSEIGDDGCLCLDFRAEGEPSVFQTWGDEEEWRVWRNFADFLASAERQHPD